MLADLAFQTVVFLCKIMLICEKTTISVDKFAKLLYNCIN